MPGFFLGNTGHPPETKDFLELIHYYQEVGLAFQITLLNRIDKPHPAAGERSTNHGNHILLIGVIEVCIHE
ncbi:MAG: hypothetical protein ISQ73_17560 [Verrucomicrobiae bacterium]|nr:hypothetical protein [Verrucomicrobiae bacterium]